MKFEDIINDFAIYTTSANDREGAILTATKPIFKHFEVIK